MEEKTKKSTKTSTSKGKTIQRKKTSSNSTQKKSTTKNVSESKKIAEEKEKNIETKHKDDTHNISKKESFADYLCSLQFLKILFFSLIVFVAVLGLFVYKKQLDTKGEKKSNIVISMNDESETSNFNINVAALLQSKEYVFRVTNKKDDIINDSTISYDITIENNNDCVIELYRDEGSKNLILDQKSSNILGETLEGGEEHNHYYHVKLVSSGKISSMDLIQVKIEKQT